MDPAMKIAKARVAMLQNNRFWGKLALDLELKAAPKFDTMATDGKHLYYNPVFVDGLSMNQLMGVIAHEVFHVANLHHTRRKGRDPKEWNVAADLAANPILVKEGFELPVGALLDPAYDGKSAEEIYRLREQQKQEQEQEPQSGEDQSEEQSGDEEQETGAGAQGDEEGDDEGEGSGEEGTPGGDPGGCGEILDAANDDGSAPSPAELSEIEADEQVKVAQAHNLAKQAGQGSTDQDRMLGELKQAQQDWKEELRRFILQRDKSDATWNRPNRRFVSQGLCLPSLQADAMGEMVVAIDLSGSVSGWISEFCAELKAIKEETRPTKLTVIYFADGVTGVDEFTADEDLIVKPRGGGGTDFRPVFKYLEDHDVNPDCVLVLTDLYGPAPTEAPMYPVLWCSTTQEKEPWGERITLRR